VLREAFGYNHREIADILTLSEANCRQLHRRARQRVGEARPRFQPDRRQRHRLVERFLAAARDGDLPGLERLLAADITSWADGGGKVAAARRPVLGRDRVARYIAGGILRYVAGMDIVVAEINGEPAVLAWAGGTLASVLVPEIADEQISVLRIVANRTSWSSWPGKRPTCHIPGIPPVPDR
jgi:hypothetical protein